MNEDITAMDISTTNPTSRDVMDCGDGWFRLVDLVNMSWRETIRPLFQYYTERTPGSFIEEKEVRDFI